MHCVAGDGVGILAGAVLSTILGLAGITEVIIEYVLGFGLGWMTFQSLFMRDMAGGSYRRALTSVRHQRLRDRKGGLRKGGFLAHRSH
jgi:hypothetical protein